MTTPAGWYDDGSGRQRWWDGAQWTEHFAPIAAPETPAAAPQQAATEAATDTSPAAQEETAATIASAAATEGASPWSQQATTTADAVDDGTAAAAQTAAADAFTADPAQPYDATQPYGVTQPYGAAPVYDPAQAYPAPGATQPYAAANPGYPGAAPGYQGDAYSQATQPYGAAYPVGSPEPSGPTPMSVVGLIGLGLAALGTILSCIPVTLVFGWILLAAGFVVSLISLFLKGKKWPGVTGLIVSVVGTVLAVVMALFFTVAAFSQAIGDLPSPAPSSDSGYSEEDDSFIDDGTTDDGTTDDGTADEGTIGVNRPSVEEVAVGLTAVIESTGAGGYTPEQITCVAQEFVNSDIDDDTLRTIADSDGMFTDVDAAYAFSEEFMDAAAVCLY